MSNNKPQQEPVELTAQELTEQVKIRREKLFNLQAEGKDPFQIVKFDVTNHGADLTENFDEYEGK